MQPTLCSRCHKNVAVIFISKLEGGETKNEGLCLKCARELGIKPIDDMMKKMEEKAAKPQEKSKPAPDRDSL